MEPRAAELTPIEGVEEDPRLPFRGSKEAGGTRERSERGRLRGALGRRALDCVARDYQHWPRLGIATTPTSSSEEYVVLVQP
jgi:hypothetical protein